MHASQTAIALTLVLGLTAMPVSVARDTITNDEIQVCAGIAKSGARLACYDKLGNRVLASQRVDEKVSPPLATPDETEPESESRPAPATAQAASDSAGTSTATPSLPDDLGGTYYEKKSGQSEYQGTVTSCRKGADDRWYFYFQSGQVWRESNIGRRRFKECQFQVTITRDSLGYKMRIDGRKGMIRVARRK